MTHAGALRAGRGAPLAAALALAALLGGCSAPAPPVEGPEEPAPTETPAEEFSIEEVDFTAVEWSLMPYAQLLPSAPVRPSEGVMAIEGTDYVVVAEGVLFSDADDDGDLDALVPVDMRDDSGTLARLWYLWADEGGEPVQVLYPAGIDLACGTTIANVSAVAGGFAFHEFHRRAGESAYLACEDLGTDERNRTVGIEAVGPEGELWPVQHRPFRAFGGVCPEPIAFHADVARAALYVAPNASDLQVQGGVVTQWAAEEWQVYRDLYPDWRLVGVSVDGESGCAWLPR